MSLPAHIDESNLIRWIVSSRALGYVVPYLRVRIPSQTDIIINDAYRNEPWIAYALAKQFSRNKTLNMLHSNFPLRSWHILLFQNMYKKLIYGALNRNLFSAMRKAGFIAYYLPNGIIFPPSSSIERQPDPHLIFIGRIDKWKRPDLAVKIAKCTKLKLFIAGPIKDNRYFQDHIKPLLNDEIVYLGELPRDRLDMYLKKSKALVFTSQFSDPHPTVLLEAIAYGVPILALRPGNFSGFYDIISNGGNSVIIDMDHIPGNIETLIDKINRWNVYSDGKINWGWESIINRYYRPVFEQLRHSE